MTKGTAFTGPGKTRSHLQFPISPQPLTIGRKRTPDSCMKKNDTATMPCPCGAWKNYEACCGRWHQGPQYLMAPDAETLMRSEERRVGKECRSRWGRYNRRKNVCNMMKR